MISTIDIIMIIADWLLLIACGGFLAVWVAVALVLHAGKRAAPEITAGLSWTPPPAAKGTSPSDTWPSLSIVIPAHDEEAMVTEALTSIAASDYAGNLEIILVADRCTDRTAERAQICAQTDPRIQIIEITACPPGWSGKCHACWQGAKQAKGALLLFTDADTIFATSLVRAAVGYLKNRQLDFLSILGSLRATKSFEKTAQPVAAIALMQYYPIHKANRADPKTRRPFANGQFMLFTRAAYEGVGTHAELKDAILEDLRFARRLSRHGYQLGLTTARNFFTVRMYDTNQEFRQGWKRILIEGANRNIPRLRTSARRLQIIAAAPLIAILASFAGIIPNTLQFAPQPWIISALGLTTLIFGASVLAVIYRIQGASARSIWRFPLGCFQIASILREAITDLEENRGIEWAKIRYHVDPKDEK